MTTLPDLAAPDPAAPELPVATPVDFPGNRPLATDRWPSTGMLSVRGSDRIAFLTRIMSGDLPPAPGATRTALLGPKGNVIAAAVATVLQDTVFLEAESSRAAALRDALDRYRIADDVEIVAVERGSASLRRTESSEFDGELAEAGAVIEFDGGFLRRDFRPWAALTCFSTGGTPPEADFVQAAADATPEEQEYLRIRAGEPRWGAELDETSLPLATGLTSHVRLGKGCYIGQEYVARQAHRGRVPRLLRGLELSDRDLPRPGAEVRFEGAPVGRITSVAARPDGWNDAPPGVALAVLAAEVPPGATVEVAGPDGTRTATVSSVG